MENTFTTNIDKNDDGIEIYTTHDQTGSGAIGFVPYKNIARLIDELKTMQGGQAEVRVKQLLADIVEHRNKLPKNWKWEKCYELSYKYYGTRKHWALKNLDKEGLVASYNLLLQDLVLRRDVIDKDETMLFIEKSLEYIDCLLEIVSKQSV